MAPDLTQHLIAQEQALQDPALRSDPAAVSALLSADFHEFSASGRIWSRDEILTLLATEAPQPITAHGFICRSLAPTLALLTYTSSNAIRSALRSSLWRLEGDGQWRIVFHQGTPIPE